LVIIKKKLILVKRVPAGQKQARGGPEAGMNEEASAGEEDV